MITLEIDAELAAHRRATTCSRAGIANAEVREADGAHGLPAEARST